MKTVKQLPFVNVDTMDSFLADLNDESNYRVLSMLAEASHLLQGSEKEGKSTPSPSHDPLIKILVNDLYGKRHTKQPDLSASLLPNAQWLRYKKR